MRSSPGGRPGGRAGRGARPWRGEVVVHEVADALDGEVGGRIRGEGLRIVRVVALPREHGGDARRPTRASPRRACGACRPPARSGRPDTAAPRRRARAPCARRSARRPPPAPGRSAPPCAAGTPRRRRRGSRSAPSPGSARARRASPDRAGSRTGSPPGSRTLSADADRAGTRAGSAAARPDSPRSPAPPGAARRWPSSAPRPSGPTASSRCRRRSAVTQSLSSSVLSTSTRNTTGARAAALTRAWARPRRASPGARRTRSAARRAPWPRTRRCRAS